MRIVIDIRPLLERSRAGVSLYTLNLVRRLAERRAHEYALFCNSSRLPFPADAPAATGGVSHHFTRYPNRLLNLSFKTARFPKIESLVGGADLVYLPNINFVATDRPFVVTIHDLAFRRYPEFFSPKQRLWHKLVDAEGLIRRAAAVIAVSNHTKSDLIESFGVDERKIHVVSPAADTREFRPRSAEEISAIKKKLGLPERFVLYLGTLEPRKNVCGLIAAFDAASTDDARLVIAGARGWMYGDIYRAAARARKRDRIIFLGYVSESDKPALYSAAAAFAYPSFYEGFGMPVLEAMSCGTPVVAGHGSSLGEVVGDAGLLVNPGNIEEMAWALETLLRDTQFRHGLRERGLRQAATFNWDDSAEGLERIFGQ